MTAGRWLGRITEDLLAQCALSKCSAGGMSATKIKLHLGCGKRLIPGFIHIDAADFPHIDYQHDISTLPFIENDGVDLIYACHVLEYFDRFEVQRVLKEWHRALKPGGTLRLAVPDLESLLLVYTKSRDVGKVIGPLFGRWEIKPGLVVYHKTVYDFASLSQTLAKAGFCPPQRYDWRHTEHRDYDDFSQAYVPHMAKESGVLISLNVEAVKPG